MTGGTGKTRWNAAARRLIDKPPFNVTIVKNGWNFGTDDIVKTIKYCVKEYQKERSLQAFAPTLDEGTNVRTLQNIYDFVQKEVKYQKDAAGYQDILQPDSVFWQGFSDCKGKSVTVWALMYELGIPFKFRFARYTSNTPNGRVTHIYGVAYLNGKEYIMDTVHTTFNEEVKPYYFEDLVIGSYPSVNGLETVTKSEYTGLVVGGLGGAVVGKSLVAAVTCALAGDFVSHKMNGKSAVFTPLIDKIKSFKFF